MPNSLKNSIKNIFQNFISSECNTKSLNQFKIKSTQSAKKIKIQPKILLVEDSPLAQRITESLFVDLHCEVITCDNAKEALVQINTKSYDMIFIDIGLPDIDGINLTKKIRRFETINNQLPTTIIGQSAQSNEENKKNCLQVGMQDLIQKPLTIQMLFKALRYYIPDYAKYYPHVKLLSKKDINNEKIIDKLLFRKITNNNPETQKTFISMTKESLQVDLPIFCKAYKENNWLKMRLITHKLRGSFACIAAMRLEKIFSRLEDYLIESKKPSFKKITLLYNSALSEIKLLKKKLVH